MKDALKEIKPTVGLGKIKFGMTREEIRDILGEPEEIDTYSFTGSDEDLSESWHYDELSLSMAFDEDEGWRLTTLSVSSNFYQLNGKSLVGLNQKDLEEELRKMNITELEYDDWTGAEMAGQKLLSAESIFVNFWLDGETLSEIQWSPEFDEDDVMHWPQ